MFFPFLSFFLSFFFLPFFHFHLCLFGYSERAGCMLQVMQMRLETPSGRAPTRAATGGCANPGRASRTLRRGPRSGSRPPRWAADTGIRFTGLWWNGPGAPSCRPGRQTDRQTDVKTDTQRKTPSQAKWIKQARKKRITNSRQNLSFSFSSSSSCLACGGRGHAAGGCTAAGGGAAAAAASTAPLRSRRPFTRWRTVPAV
jgi:hypothetical protein